MATSPTTAKLRSASDALLVFNPAPIPLPETDAGLASDLNQIATNAEFSRRPFAIIDQSHDAQKTLLNEPDQNWNLGSTGKLGVAFGAFALRKDVQNLRLAGAIASLAEADAIMEHVWSVSDREAVRRIGADKGFPIPSNVLEWDATGVFFQGERSTVDFTRFENLPDQWEPFIARIEGLTFWERLLFMLKASEGVSTRHIQGAVGIRYTNAALEALGLFNPEKRSGLRIGGAYAPSAASFMRLRQPRSDSSQYPRGKNFSGKNPRAELPYCGTARTLAALMNAIFNQSLFGFHASMLFQDLLHNELDMRVNTDALDGVLGYLNREILDQVSEGAWCKVGIWQNRADFTRIQYGDIEYGMVLLGYRAKAVGRRFGSAVHQRMELRYPL